jgi:hypothetical protein
MLHMQNRHNYQNLILTHLHLVRLANYSFRNVLPWLVLDSKYEPLICKMFIGPAYKHDMHYKKFLNAVTLVSKLIQFCSVHSCIISS